jgi:UDP-N-acetylmuramoyl-tripeptide--D-alanyl-D-alanine ligase
MKLSVNLSELAAVVGGELHGPPAVSAGLAIDSRAIEAGNLFVAIKGERVDGHDYLGLAKEAGATGALVSELRSVDLPQILVDDTQFALERFAAWYRSQLQVRFIGVTGSAGKTTVKSLLAHLLSGQAKVGATKGNYNNELGVPLTLLSLGQDLEFAVVEMGARFKGDIAHLCQLVKPQIRILTSVLPAHIGTFGSLDVIAQTKGEIFDEMQSSDLAIMTADVSYVGSWKERVGGQALTYGFAENADVRIVGAQDKGLDGVAFGIEGVLGTHEFHSPLLGLHNVGNVVASIIAAIECGLSAGLIRSQLATFQAVDGRMRILTLDSGQRVIDDSYNANPAATKGALSVLSNTSGCRFALLGTMAELGENERAYHNEVADLALELDLDTVWCVGPLWPVIEGKLFRYFQDADEVVGHLTEIPNFDVALVKGSRSVGLDKVVEALARPETRLC